jgi:hypothetical protein
MKSYQKSEERCARNYFFTDDGDFACDGCLLETAPRLRFDDGGEDVWVFWFGRVFEDA